jgi:alpha-tubulin suppressor-like RCC1 family protein
MKISSTFRALGGLAVLALLPACGIGGGGGTLTPTVAPGTPGDVRARPGNRSVKVTWTSSAIGAQYGIFRALTAAGPFFQVPGIGQLQDGSSFVDTNVVNGTEYFYQVAAINSFGSSAPSPVVSGTPGFFATQISCYPGGSTFCALLQDGSVWSWGFIAGTIGSSVPYQIPGLTDVSSVAGGGGQSLALTSDGRVWCWGDNTYGQRGNGSTDPVPPLNPTVVSTLSGVQAISSGADSNYALLQDGTVWAWGWNASGELGVPAAVFTNSAVPIQVPGLHDIIAISAGTQFCLALARDGLVWAWGTNTEGTLANGTTSHGNFPTPAPILSLTSVTAIAAGAYHCVALKADGTMWFWGFNGTGEFGNGATGSTPIWVPSQVPGLAGVAAIGAGHYHTVAAKKDGTVLCWGENTYGESGGALSAPVLSPTVVPGLAGIVSVYGSSANTMALGADGSVWVWGDNRNDGELGSGTGYIDPLPQVVPNFAGVVGAASGFQWSMAVRSDKTVWVWGMDNHGILGDGTAGGKVLPVPNKNPTLSNVSGISAGSTHALAILFDNTVWAWGANDSGQVGNNSASTADVLTPTPVLTQALSISAGFAHSLAVRSDNTLWSWGNNLNGQLGTGTVGTNIILPTKITALSAVTAASAGTEHSLALLADGSVWAWGDNSKGELGQPTASLGGSIAPVLVAGLPKAIAVAAGQYFSVALAADGTVWSWGDNSLGALGRSGTPDTPGPVDGLSNVIAVSASSAFAMALLADGTVRSWGSDAVGQSGNLAINYTSTPAPVLGLTNIASISAAPSIGMAVGKDGLLWTWGYNSDSELGIPIVAQTNVPVQITR